MSFLSNIIEYSTNLLFLLESSSSKADFLCQKNIIKYLNIIVKNGASAYHHHFQASTYQVFKM